VVVSVVHIAFGAPTRAVTDCSLDGRRVFSINSRLRAGVERPDPKPLRANRGIAFTGVRTYGDGFILDGDQRKKLVEASPRNAERIFEYIGGEEVNTDPDQRPHRYAINFGEMTLHDAESWPALLEHVRASVKPGRLALKPTADGLRLKRLWWQYHRTRTDMYSAIAPLTECLVTSRVAKHLAFSLQPTNRLFSDALVIFAADAMSTFGILQSRVHEVWARLLSSSMKTDLRYSTTDCFDTFPFPEPNPLAKIPEVEVAGRELYEERRTFMSENSCGLTQTYNFLKDPGCTDHAVGRLRRLHRELDRAVLHAYGWDDLEVPPYCTGPYETTAIGQFHDELLDRLALLNVERASA